MKVLCSRCKGTKKFRGLGCVVSICPGCNGVGFIEAAKIISDDGEKKQKRVRNIKNDQKETD